MTWKYKIIPASKVKAGMIGRYYVGHDSLQRATRELESLQSSRGPTPDFRIVLVQLSTPEPYYDWALIRIPGPGHVPVAPAVPAPQPTPQPARVDRYGMSYRLPPMQNIPIVRQNTPNPTNYRVSTQVQSEPPNYEQGIRVFAEYLRRTIEERESEWADQYTDVDRLRLNDAE